MRALLRWLVIATVAGTFDAGAAESSAARQHFETGRAAYESNDLERALAEFEAARDAGLPGPAIHYNIGATAYRLGRYETAKRAFREVARTPEMAPLAHYNLGLVALRRGDERAAARLFTSASRSTADESLRGLADAQLGRLDLDAPAAVVARFASLGVGYDDNVALIADADLIAPTGVTDAFLQAQFAIAGPLDRALRFEGALFHTNYLDLDRFDELTVSAGARYRTRVDAWTHEAAAGGSLATLDGDDFERRGSITLQTRRDVASNWAASARFRFTDVTGLDDFDLFTGTRRQLGIRLERPASGSTIRFDYAFERSDLADPLLSSDRQSLGAELRSERPSGWGFAVGAEYRRGDYGEDATDGRTEDQSLIGLEATRSFREYWRLIVRYDYLVNESNDVQFDFRRNRITAVAAAIW